MTPTTSAPETRPTVAVIGSGVSGLTAAYLLDRTHDVTLFEADDRLGGHAHTHDVTASDGSLHAVDSGFIVHNDRTYPWLRKLFAELDIAVRPTEMSMSIRCEQCGLEYAGGRGVRGMLAQRSRALNPQFLSLLAQVRRFHRRASHFLLTSAQDDLTTYGQFLEREGFSRHFITHYAVPVVSCVWSSGQETALLYPARYLFRFLDHHGLLSVSGSPTWFTVEGGSRTYVEKLGALLPAVRVRRPVLDVTRHADGVVIRAGARGSHGADGSEEVHRFDRVVIATHADQALALLSDPSDAEVQTLKAFQYSQNDTLLHTDASILPWAKDARASWNYLMTSCTDLDDATVVTYWMNRLQGHESPQDYLVTLNARERIDPGAIIAEMDYEHPIYTPEAVAAQGSLAGLATDRTVFAGAYHGWGFHEDGCRSGVEAARAFGVDW